MFEETEIIEFINRIANSSDACDEEIKVNVGKFYDYLALTKM